MELSRVTTITWRTSIPFHVWRYSPFWALASLKACLHSSLFSSLLLHPLTPNSCNASLWTTSAHLVLGLPTGLVLWRVPFKTFFGILSPLKITYTFYNVKKDSWTYVLTLNLPKTTIVAQPFNVIKWQLKFNPVA